MSIANVSARALEDIRPSKTIPDYFAMVSNAADSDFNASFSPTKRNLRVQDNKNLGGLSGVSFVTSTTLSTPVGEVEIRVDEYVDETSNPEARQSKLTGRTPHASACAAPKLSESSESTRSSPEQKLMRRGNSDAVAATNQAANHDGSYSLVDKAVAKMKAASSETTLDEEVFLIDDRRRVSCTPGNDDCVVSGLNGSPTNGADADPDIDSYAPAVRKKTSAEKLSSVRGTLRRALSSRRRQRRLIFKDGTVNISTVNVEKKKRRYLVDLFTTLVDIKWRYSLLLFVLTFISSWLFFACVWYVLAVAHGDLDDTEHQNASVSPNSTDTIYEKPTPAELEIVSAKTKCIMQINSFLSAVLFSIETQQTIGFGHRYVTDNDGCSCWNIVIMMMQSCCGVIIQALMTGIVFAKLSRPKKRAQTLMFSKNAVICMRDGGLCLLFRVGDMRKSHIINTHIRGILIQKRLTQEGEQLPMSQYEIDFGFTDGTDRPFLIWPVIIEHKITPKSPFWELTARCMKRIHFELIVILEGIVESTGMTTQARSSYLPNEILWGHRFEKLISYEKDNGQFHIDFSKFHETQRIENFTMQSAAEVESARQAALASKKPPIVMLNGTVGDDSKLPLVQSEVNSARLTPNGYDDEDTLSSITCVSARSCSFTPKNSEGRKEIELCEQTPSDGSGQSKRGYGNDDKASTRVPLSPRRLSIPVDIGRPLPRRSSQQENKFGRRLQRLNPTSELSVSFSKLDK